MSATEDFEKEFEDAFYNYNKCVDAVVRRATELDKANFKVYDFISREIPYHREVSLVTSSDGTVTASSYLRLLDSLEFIYSVVKGVL